MKEQPKSREQLIEKLLQQIDLCDFQTKDGMHELKRNKAYLELKENISRVSGEPPKPVVLVSRISDLVHKCADWKDGEITGFRMDEFEIRLSAILEKLSGGSVPTPEDDKLKTK